MMEKACYVGVLVCTVVLIASKQCVTSNLNSSLILAYQHDDIRFDENRIIMFCMTVEFYMGLVGKIKQLSRCVHGFKILNSIADDTRAHVGNVTEADGTVVNYDMHGSVDNGHVGHVKEIISNVSTSGMFVGANTSYCGVLKIPLGNHGVVDICAVCSEPQKFKDYVWGMELNILCQKDTLESLILFWSNGWVSFVDTFSTQLDYKDQTNKDSAVDVNICVMFVSYGSILSKPSSKMCSVSLNVNQNIKVDAAFACGFDTDSTNFHMFVLNSSANATCDQTSDSYFQQFKIKWVSSKVNYVLYGTSFVLFAFLLNYRRYFGGQNSKTKLIFVLCNVIWVLWGLQETLHRETMWRDMFPYVCIAMCYIQYISQATSLYLFTHLSVERLHAVASPFQHRYHTALGSMSKAKCVLIIIAFSIGSVCATLNLAAILTFQEFTVKQTCRLSVSDSVHENLGLTISVKVLTLVLVFLLPCIILVCSNVAIVILLKKRPKIPKKTVSQDCKESEREHFDYFPEFCVCVMLLAQTHLRYTYGCQSVHYRF